MAVATRRKRRTVSKTRLRIRSRTVSGTPPSRLAPNRGSGVARVSSATTSTPPSGFSSSHIDRATRLIGEEIEFIANEAFLSGEAELFAEPSVESAEESVAEVSRQTSAARSPGNMPAHLARLCAAELLTAGQERELFRRMNYLKYRANQIRLGLDADYPDVAQLDQLEQHLIEARQLRDRIVEANMRLVFSIVKRFVTPQCSFDDLLSEGIRTLMITVEKFDYGRGFRFSTYTYRAISRTAYRAVADCQKHNARFTTSCDTLADAASEDDAAARMDEKTAAALRARLAKFVHQLDRRERFIIRGRYALGSHRRARTFQDLADLLGLSKERVRQLEQRALEKLKEMAAEIADDELVVAVSWQ